jgi:hypothetical protein
MSPACMIQPPAQALKMVELRDGSQVEVFEHGMSLSIVALRGSVPAQWIMDYRSTLGKYSGFGLGQRHQINDIYQVHMYIPIPSPMWDSHQFDVDI